MIIMKLVSLNAIKLLSKGSGFTVNEIAQKLNIHNSSVSRAVKELEQKKLVEREGRTIRMARHPAAQQFLWLSSKFAPEKILLDSRESIIMALSEPKTKQEISIAAKLSEVQVSRLLKSLSGTGAVFLDKEKFVLNEEIKKLVVEMNKTAKLEGIEPFATLVFSNGSKLKKVPLGANANGTLTAFSRFAEHGIDYATINDFYAEPPREVSIEEIFVHSLAASENKKDLAMCLVFYEKNKSEMEAKKIVHLSLEFKVMLLFFDCLAFLDKREVREKERFLPWSEFMAIAQSYGLKTKQKFSAKDLEALLLEIGKTLKKPLEIFLIGGCNLALQGIKQATKDIDIVVKNEKDFEALTAALKKIGFSNLSNPETPYKKMNPNAILVHQKKPRVDIFTKIVCNALKLSDKMVDHSLEQKKENLYVKFLRPEDIILFKAITERDGDLEDIATIIRHQKPKWDYFMQELKTQHDASERLFCLDVLNTLEILEEKEKIKFEKKQELLDFCLEKGILFLAKTPASIAQIKEKIRFPETTIRNKIVQLVKAKKITKTKEKPFKIVLF